MFEKVSLRPHLQSCCTGLDFVALICPKVLNMSADINVVLSSEFCIVPVQHENATIEAVNILKHLSSATLV